MCGITTVIGKDYSEEQMNHALKSIEHRGPDALGSYQDQETNVTLGFARLSIIDHSTGMQPLISECGNIAVVCNGEIYDFERIRGELELKGHRFSTKGDIEIIIYAYLEYGMEFFKELRGEFSFVLLDKRKNKLLAVRDRFGINPLYYSILQDGSFVFSSEAKGLFGTGLVKPEIDPVALRNMMSVAFVDTVFKNVKAVPPANYLSIDLKTKKHKIKPYWQIDLPKDEDCDQEKSLEDYKQLVRDQLDEAVKHRLRADVEVGVYLSGGIDSAAIAGTVAKLRPDQPLKVFNVSFPEDRQFDEHDRAQIMADSIGAEFHSVKCERTSLVKNFEASLWHCEIPVPNLHGVARYMLAQYTKKYLSVVITGEGSDENFLGYEYFKGESINLSNQIEGAEAKNDSTTESPETKRMKKELGFVPQFEFIKNLSQAHQDRLNGLFQEKHQDALKNSHAMDQVKARIDREQTDKHDFKRQRQFYSIKGILSPYIIPILGDRPEFAFGMESRPPILDHKLFEACKNIPDKWKIHEGKEKYVFREAVRDRVTKEMYEIKKWPFAAPPVWVRKGESQEMNELIDKYFTKEAIEEAGIFEYKKIAFFKLMHRLVFFDCAFKRKINTALTLILSVQILHHLYVKEFEESSKRFDFGTRAN